MNYRRRNNYNHNCVDNVNRNAGQFEVIGNEIELKALYLL